MRRREKFVITAFILSALLFGVLMVPPYFRFFAIFGLTVASYLLSAWALADDLQRHELLTVVPFPTLYTLASSSFYFVLPASWLNQFLLITLFGIGIYALLLTSNIFSVAKGRTIQLLYAAQTISLFFTLLISFFLSSTIFSLNLPLPLIAFLLGISHGLLILLSIWHVRLRVHLETEEWLIAGLITLVIMQFVVAIAFIPFERWVLSVLIMSLLYLLLGLAQSYLLGRLFTRTIKEYSLVAIFVLLLFILLFPGK